MGLDVFKLVLGIVRLRRAIPEPYLESSSGQPATHSSIGPHLAWICSLDVLLIVFLSFGLQRTQNMKGLARSPRTCGLSVAMRLIRGAYSPSHEESSPCMLSGAAQTPWSRNSGASKSGSGVETFILSM